MAAGSWRKPMSDAPIRVFLVEDHTFVREGLANLIEGSDKMHVVGQCGDGLQAIREIKRTDPDVAVLDVLLPGLNGLEICRGIAGKPDGVAVVMLSFLSDEQVIARALKNGALGYLLKESAYSEVKKAIETVARGKLYLGDGISRDVLSHLPSGVQDPVGLPGIS